MRQRISMVTLGVADLPRSVRFYQELGLTKLESPPSVAFFRLAGSWLGLYGRQDLAEDAGVSSDGGGFRGVTIAHNVASEAEVDAVMLEAEAAGATVVKAAGKAEWGGYHGYFADPDGHLWEVACNPFEWIGPPDAAVP